MLSKKGFTLIEFLIYLAIVGVVLAVGTTIFFNVLYGRAKMRSIEEVTENGRRVVERVVYEISRAEAVNDPAPAADGDALSLAVVEAALDPTVFRLSGTNLEIQTGAEPPQVLNNNLVEISALNFANVTLPGTAGAARITVTVRHRNPSGRPEYDFEKTFYATAIIRK